MNEMQKRLESGDLKHDKLHECMDARMQVKITNIKSQITSKSQNPMTKITKKEDPLPIKKR